MVIMSRMWITNSDDISIATEFHMEVDLNRNYRYVQMMTLIIYNNIQLRSAQLLSAVNVTK